MEAAILLHLAGGVGYRVQVLLDCFDSDGELVLVTRWEEGSFKPWDRITEEEWAQLGAELAALHARLAEGELPVTVEQPARDLAREQARILADRARVEDEEVRRYLDGRLRLLRPYAPAPGPLQPIHNDFNQYNYLFGPTAPPLVLDWERALRAPREYEVVRCLNHLPLAAPKLAGRFLDGYRRRLPLDPRRLKWAIDAALTEHAVKHWPLERWLSGDPRWLRGNMEMVHTFLARRAELDEFYS